MWSEQGTLLMPRSALICVVLAVSALSLLNAAVTTVKSGTVEAVSDAKQTITVKFAHSESATELKVLTDTSIHLDGASSELTALKPGMSVTVQVGSDGEAERILAHTANDRPASTSTGKSPKPKTTAHKPPKSKSSRTASKTHSKRKSDASPFDSAPVMTTPLGTLKNPELTSSPSAASSKSGWPCFLGPNHDNVSQETGLMSRWPPQGPSLAWHTQGLGQGFSTVSIADGMVFSMGTPDNQESVLAIGLADGKALWSLPTGGSVFQEASGNGPRSTPTVDGGRVYALGASGDLICVDIKSKSVRWRKNLPQEFAAPVLQYGFAESVLIDGPRLICTPGGQAATIAALDKDSGAVIWKSKVPTLPAAAYASPIVAVVGGTRQYIDLLSRGVVGVKATDGQFLWGNDTVANANAICSTPLFIKDHVFVSASYGAGAALINLVPGDQGDPGEPCLSQPRDEEPSWRHGGRRFLRLWRRRPGPHVLQSRDGPGCLEKPLRRQVLAHLRGRSPLRPRRKRPDGAGGSDARAATARRAVSCLPGTVPLRPGRTPSWPPAGSSCATRTICSATRCAR